MNIRKAMISLTYIVFMFFLETVISFSTLKSFRGNFRACKMVSDRTKKIFDKIEQVNNIGGF